MCWGCRGRFDALSSSRWRVGICAQQRSNFLLLRQKKVTKEKASRRQGRSAVPCAARTARGLAKLASLGQRQPLSERRSAAQPCLNGGEFKHPNIPAARVGAVPRRYEEASSAEAGGSGAQMFEPVGRVSAHPARIEQRSVPAQPGDESGSPFFWVLIFGEAKKSTSPAGARPGLYRDGEGGVEVP